MRENPKKICQLKSFIPSSLSPNSSYHIPIDQNNRTVNKTGGVFLRSVCPHERRGVGTLNKWIEKKEES
jgi:hypothetical protein